MRKSSMTSFISWVIYRMRWTRWEETSTTAQRSRYELYQESRIHVIVEQRKPGHRRSLKKLLNANSRLNTAYLLKETFGQLWNYKTDQGARASFERWKESLKRKGFKPHQKFAAMIERNWDGTTSYYNPENKVSLGLVEEVNNNIRLIQRRDYGFRDEDYLKRKIVVSFLPPLPKKANINPLRPA